MGSLMGGWDSTVKDPKTVLYQRNKSLTKEGIDAYWKTKRKTEEEHLSAISGIEHEFHENIQKASSQKIQKSIFFPVADDKKDSPSNASEKNTDLFRNRSCWWTRSNMAFLNEPPVITMEGPHKYASQYNVAKFGSSQAINNSSIST